MNYDQRTLVLHWNYRGFTEFPIQKLEGDEAEVTDIYLKENLISQIPTDIGKLVHLESLYLSGNDIAELPGEISKLRYLKCLDLSGNRLRRLPEEIADVRRLKFLILDENELTELPPRIAELRSLRYLSVCDNKLTWLPQRPVHNYYHCEFRFWRNPGLKTIPYSLWYHMFRGQQTRSLNIGCLTIPRYQHTTQSSRCRLKITEDSREWEVDVDIPPYNTLLETKCNYPPSLLEISKRTFYKLLIDTAKNISGEGFNFYKEDRQNWRINNGNLEDQLNYINDLNGNNLSCRPLENICHRRLKEGFVPKDVLEEHYNFLPSFMMTELSNGPISRCENLKCKVPVFDYAFYEFCIGNIILIDNTEEVILSAAFCSKSCADFWKTGRTNLLTWSLKNEG